MLYAGVVPVLNRQIAEATRKGWPVYASRDWHPRVTRHFKEFGGQWPVHCVQDTPGAAFSAQLRLPSDTTVISKATLKDQEAYSSFHGTDLATRLRAAGIRRVFIGGLTTDYCVLNSVRDARNFGYEVFVLADAIRAVDVNPGDGKRAEEEMASLGAHRITLGGLAE